MRSVSLFLCCCCILAVINISCNSLTPVVKSDSEYEYVLRIISRYDSFKNFYNFVLFLGHLDEDTESIVSTSLPRRVMQIFGRPVIIAGTETKSLYNIISTYNFAVVLYSGLHDPILNVVINALGEMSTIPILFVYKSADDVSLQADRIYEFFNWCWKSGFRNLVIATEKNNDMELWTYEMDEGIEVHKITESYINSFKNRNHDLINRRHLRVAIFQNLPYAFVLNSSDHRDLTGGNISLGGLTGIMLGEFVRFIGGTFDILPQSNDTYCTNVTVCRIGDKIIDIGANMVAKTEIASYSPFMMSTKYCLVVPFERELPLAKYFTVFCGNSIMNTFSAFYFLAMALLRRLINPQKSLVDLIFNIIQISWGLALPSRIINRMARSDKILTICALIFNLLLSTYFGSVLATVLTTGIHLPDIVDVQTFVANDINIMVSESQMNEIFKIKTFPVELLDRMFSVEREILHRHLSSLDDNYVYLLETHRFEQIKFLQERLSRPKLKLAPEPLCTLDLYLRIPIRQELGFALVLTRFIDNARESGLTKKWMRMGLQQLKQTNLIRQASYDPLSPKPLKLSFFTFGFQIFCAGMLLSMMVMLIECIYGYWWERCNNFGNVIIV